MTAREAWVLGKMYFDSVRDMGIKLVRVSEWIKRHTHPDDPDVFLIPADACCDCARKLDGAQAACNEAYDLLKWTDRTRDMVQEICNSDRFLAVFDAMAKRDNVAHRYERAIAALDGSIAEMERAKTDPPPCGHLGQ